MPRVESPAQLCWNCANACGGCSWSARFEPVEGWTATPKIIRRNAHGPIQVDTYCITKCPEFKPDSGKVMADISDEAIRVLSKRVLIQAGRDYADDNDEMKRLKNIPRSEGTEKQINATKADIRMIEKFLRDGNLFTALLGLDGGSLLAGLRRSGGWKRGREHV